MKLIKPARKPYLNLLRLRTMVNRPNGQNNLKPFFSRKESDNYLSFYHRITSIILSFSITISSDCFFAPGFLQNFIKGVSFNIVL